METGFDQNLEQNIEKLKDAISAFMELDEACESYAARNPRTKNGKIRREIVLQIQGFAKKDASGCAAALSEFYRMPPEEQARQTWTSVLQKARSLQISVDDFSKLERPGGGQVSEVFKIRSGEGEHAKTGYFKKEDGIDVSGAVGKENNQSAYVALTMTLKKYPDLPKNDIKVIEKRIASNKMFSSDLSGDIKEVFDYLLAEQNKIMVNVDEVMTPMGIIDEGGIVNTTRRNVASSRVAELLGLGNLLAHSQTVDIYDKASGQTIRGNLMDQAKGVEYNQVVQNLKEDKYTAGFIRDTLNLQVLDMICGQVDRHVNNLLYQTNENGEVTGIQGIDNDASFGTNTDAVSGTVDLNRKDRRVFNEKTKEMLVPYMDAKLAARIEAIDSSMIKYFLSDLLRKAEVDAAMKRFEVIKEGVKMAKELHPERFLEEEDWNKEVVGAKLLEDTETKNQKLYEMETGVAEYFKEDPNGDAEEYKKIFGDPVEAFILNFRNPTEFSKRYTQEDKAKLMKLSKKVSVFLGHKYEASMSYFGAFVPAKPKVMTIKK